MTWHRVSNTYNYIISTFFVSLAFQSFAAWQKIPQPPGPHGEVKFTVQRFPHIVYGSDQWHTFEAISALAVVFYLGVHFVYWSWGVFWATEKTRKDPNYIEGWSFFLAPYLPERWWFGIILAISNLLQAFVPNMTEGDGRKQCLLLAFILAVTLVLQTLCWPWKHHHNNILACTLQFVSLMFAIIGAVRSSALSGFDDGSTYMRYVMYAGLAIALIAVSFAVYTTIVMSTQRYKLQRKEKVVAEARTLKTLCKHVDEVAGPHLFKRLHRLSDPDRNVLTSACRVLRVEVVPGGWQHVDAKKRLSVSAMNIAAATRRGLALHECEPPPPEDPVVHILSVPGSPAVSLGVSGTERKEMPSPKLPSPQTGSVGLCNAAGVCEGGFESVLSVLQHALAPGNMSWADRSFELCSPVTPTPEPASVQQTTFDNHQEAPVGETESVSESGNHQEVGMTSNGVRRIELGEVTRRYHMDGTVEGPEGLRDGQSAVDGDGNLPQPEMYGVPQRTLQETEILHIDDEPSMYSGSGRSECDGFGDSDDNRSRYIGGTSESSQYSPRPGASLRWRPLW
eukprot:GDKI01015077.1.p1 GENE.GDKI01015077.1~~GDKI01015077.1.p1  ORF type:complete len:565 (+),score=64.87 GDKI01015077.1:58-1752(+)